MIIFKLLQSFSISNLQSNLNSNILPKYSQPINKSPQLTGITNTRNSFKCWINVGLTSGQHWSNIGWTSPGDNLPGRDSILHNINRHNRLSVLPSSLAASPTSSSSSDKLSSVSVLSLDQDNCGYYQAINNNSYRHLCIIPFNPQTARLNNLNLHPPEVEDRGSETQFQVGENYAYIFFLIWDISFPITMI